MVKAAKKSRSKKIAVVGVPGGKTVLPGHVLDLEDEIEPDAFKSLTDDDKAFCREYVLDWNGRRAYGKLHPKVSEITAGNKAVELLSRKRIRLYCEYLNENVEFTTGVSRTWVLQQHLKLVRSSIAHLHDTWITLKDFESLTEDQKFCIEEITTQTRHEVSESEDGEIDIQVDYVKLKLYNKQKSLDAITRLMGYERAQKVDVTSNGKTLAFGGAVVNLQVNVYNTAPPLADSEQNIKD